MNLYKFHSDPKPLLNHDLAKGFVPRVFAPGGDYGNFPKNLSPAQIKAISLDAVYACQYAQFVIKGIWPEAEPYIMRDPESAFLYAIDRIRGRWPEAEPYIMKDSYWWDRYEIYFLFD
jgi:hypothetical protein